MGGEINGDFELNEEGSDYLADTILERFGLGKKLTRSAFGGEPAAEFGQQLLEIFCLQETLVASFLLPCKAGLQPKDHS